ncbi:MULTISPECIES: phosphatase PAP2 family protein [unclassified Saccharicrinis]|uniref:phosphatase PAP2 family protein n=1 Tax=unclassified Saccharicrinis TaxID=2646859 RepID=UPI003D326989
MKNSCIIVVLICVLIQNINSQKTERDSTSIYKINKTIEIPVTVGLFVGSYFGFRHLSDKGGLSQAEVEALDTKDIWRFDRWAAEQDASQRNDFHNSSDVFLNSSLALPIILGLDKEIRKDWFDILVMYTEMHGVNNAFYVAGASTFNRKRPFIYSDLVPMDERTAPETENSFFSGHASTAAASAFFAAKVYSDYHPELGNKKYWLYGAAMVPPTLVGYYRIKAMKHFPTDIIVGTAIGAAVGILVPHFHKRKKESSFSWSPVAGSYMTGITAKYTFK